MLSILLVVALVLALVALAVVAARSARHAAELESAERELGLSNEKLRTLEAEAAVLRESDRALAVANTRLEEKDAEVARLRIEATERGARVTQQDERLQLMSERLREVQGVVEGAAGKSELAKAGTERIENHLLGKHALG
jgi:hypothetical protein